MANGYNHPHIVPIRPVPHIRERVAICVCTLLRPHMLERCLASLGKMRLPVDIIPFLIVVDNDEGRSGQDAYVAFAASAPFSCYYANEKVRGPAAARNMACAMADTLGADWVAFIDDDEVADRDWLTWLMAYEYRDVAVLTGRHVLLPPEPTPYWWVNQNTRRREGARLRTAYTNNVRFSIDLWRKDGLRFDEALAQGGGEDAIFFTRAVQAGHDIRATERAITYETEHRARLTYRRIFARRLWEENANFTLDVIRYGYFSAFMLVLPEVFYDMLAGTVLYIGAPAAYLADQNLFKRLALAAGHKWARALGRLTAFVGYVPQPYRTIDGD